MGDNAIRETDTDAAVSRLSAVNAGYMQDAYASFFVKRSQKRPPLINVGTFIRTWALDKLVHQYLASNHYSKKQIVSLGAGTDTRFFRFQSSSSGAVKDSVARYIEVDFPEATTRKAMTIKKHPVLSEILGPDAKLELGGTSLVSSKYALIPGDLRAFEDLHEKLQGFLDPDLPTLVLAECVFIYIEPSRSNAILKWFVQNYSKSGLACLMYDPVGLEDSFGKVMINNLQARGIQLRGTSTNNSLRTIEDRLEEVGFTAAKARDVCKIRKEDVPAHEMERLSRLEGLDEVEELDLLLSHYSVAWACMQDEKGLWKADFSLSARN